MSEFNEIKKRVDDLVKTIGQRANGVVRVEEAAEELEMEVLPNLYKLFELQEKQNTEDKNKIACKKIKTDIHLRVKGALQAKDYCLLCIDAGNYETAKFHAKNCLRYWSKVWELIILLENHDEN